MNDAMGETEAEQTAKRSMFQSGEMAVTACASLSDRAPTRLWRKRLCFLGKSSSDSELTPAKNKERWSFLQCLTVDELARYRRRRFQGRPPKDTPCKTEGYLNNITSEYRRAFRAGNEDISKENRFPLKKKYHHHHHQRYQSRRDLSRSFEPHSLDNLSPGQAQEFPNDTIELSPRKKRSTCDPETDDIPVVMETKTESSKFVPHRIDCRRALQRRGTSLRHDGKFRSDTEQSLYVAHEGHHRAALARRPTSLRMEGDMATMSEKRDKFIEWLNVSRPELARLPNQLRLEGELETSTENHANYVPFVGARRPELLRQSAMLKMDGESFYVPEYKAVFKDHNVTERPLIAKPGTNLNLEGRHYNTCTETSEKFVNPRMINEKSTRNANLKERQENDDRDVPRNTGIVDEDIPRCYEDFRESTVDNDYNKEFFVDRAKLAKPDEEIGKSDGSKVFASPGRSRFITKIDADPEYRSKYLDSSTHSLAYRKSPAASTRPSAGDFSRHETFPDNLTRSGGNLNRIGRYAESPRFDGTRYHFQPAGEVGSQYRPYYPGHVPGDEPIKMPINLQSEGIHDLLSGYRNAYYNEKNYQASGEPRMHRRRERSSSESRRRENANNNVDREAFRVLSTRVSGLSEEGGGIVVAKPPSGSRRTSLIQRQQHENAENSVGIRKRDESPTYRLHVCNVDDVPRGFGRRRDSTVKRGAENQPDAIHRGRAYSPSFARETKRTEEAEEKSFHILDDERMNDPMSRYKNEIRNRRRPSINNYVDGVTKTTSDEDIIGSMNKTTQKWMRPWYDNAGTI